MGSSIDDLTRIIMAGLPEGEARANLDERTKSAIDAIFGERYHAKSLHSRRVVLMGGEDNVSFAGLVHHDSPSSGVYGGMSLIWFPVATNGSTEPAALLTLVCGTRGLSPDEHILGRPGHVRHLRAFHQYLVDSAHAESWVKHDPTDLSAAFPKAVPININRFGSVIKRYGSHIYMCIPVPTEFEKARTVISGLLDFYAWERNWQPLKAVSNEIESLKLKLRSMLFPRIDRSALVALLRQRRFIIIQGPPGTGKTRLATQILRDEFNGHGFSVQFHPAVTYETFVSGISPRVDGDTLHFCVKPGWLVEAIKECNNKPFLLHIDEINRADLARVLGEAIYLFEPREIAKGEARTLRLPNVTDGNEESISIPENLYVLGTMNSADRSIAIMDMAVRRRFAFVDVWPDLDVIHQQNFPLATESFSRLQDIFTQYATNESFCLMPGHSYFLADSEEELSCRLKFELLPLLAEYLQEGRLLSCESELRAYMDWVSSRV
jgi:5-methylcytosine-specific restriction enzyme B